MKPPMMPALKLGKSIAKVWVGPNRPRPQYNQFCYMYKVEFEDKLSSIFSITKPYKYTVESQYTRYYFWSSSLPILIGTSYFVTALAILLELKFVSLKRRFFAYPDLKIHPVKEADFPSFFFSSSGSRFRKWKSMSWRFGSNGSDRELYMQPK